MRGLAIVVFCLCLIPTAVRAAPPEIWIEHPNTAKAVFGVIDFVTEVASDEAIVKVDFYIDGKARGMVSKPPWRIGVDVGQENVPHEFRAVVRTITGQTAESTLTTPMLRIDEAIDVDLRQLYVTVTSYGDRLLNLHREDFRIFDEGKRQEIVTFERGEIPVTAILLLDCSESMEGDRLDAALAGARTFLSGMQPLDEAKVMLFSDRLLRATDFTADEEILFKALEDVRPVGGTSLNDHLFMALKKLDAQQGRRVVILFSDGADIHSVLPMNEVLRKARSSQALIYWIHLIDPNKDESDIGSFTSAWRDVEANEIEYRLLRDSVRQSGGRDEALEEIAALDGAFAEILAELRQQYVLGYYPTHRRSDGRWHSVKVRVNRPDAKVRTRGGYLDY